MRRAAMEEALWEGHQEEEEEGEGVVLQGLGNAEACYSVVTCSEAPACPQLTCGV